MHAEESSHPVSEASPAARAPAGRDRRLCVSGAAEAGDPAFTVGDRTDQHRAVGDRLVAGKRDAALY